MSAVSRSDEINWKIIVAVNRPPRGLLIFIEVHQCIDAILLLYTWMITAHSRRPLAFVVVPTAS